MNGGVDEEDKMGFVGVAQRWRGGRDGDKKERES